MMLRREFLINSVAAGSLLAASGVGFGQEGSAQRSGAPNSGYAPVNGLRLYYEIHGDSGSVPLILLHGALASAGIFSGIMPALSSGRKIIAVDLQAHGRTADIDRPLALESMANDIAGLLKYLRIEKADVMGYSMGGGVALRTAIQNPELVRKLVVVSIPCRRDGWYPEVLAQMAQIGPQAAEQMKQSPMYEAYTRIAPKPEDWTTMVVKVGALVRKDYDWTQEVSAIKAPTLLAFGDADAVRPEHAVQFFQLLGGGKKDGGWDGSGISNARLAILPGVTHYNIFAQPALAGAVVAFLEAPTQ